MSASYSLFGTEGRSTQLITDHHPDNNSAKFDLSTGIVYPERTITLLIIHFQTGVPPTELQKGWIKLLKEKNVRIVYRTQDLA
jgi:hypothetical protein